jgi:hypothetical protein
MCLSTVDRVEKIKEPMTVYKVVEKHGNKRMSMLRDQIGNFVFAYEPGLNCTNLLGRKKLRDSYWRKYTAGFHAFINRDDAEFLHRELGVYHLYEVVECTVPAGTEVTFGTTVILWQGKYKAVVSRKLIFPEPPHA